MTRRDWLGLTAHYSSSEDAMMRELKRSGLVRELQVIHELKALLGARVR